MAVAREVGLPAVADGSIDFTGLEGDLTIAGLGPRLVVVDVKNIVPRGDPSAANERKEAKNETDYKRRCARAGLDFSPFVTTIWGGFGVKAELLMKAMADRLVERFHVSNSWARSSIRRRIQAAVKRIALNGLAAMRQIRARMITQGMY